MLYTEMSGAAGERMVRRQVMLPGKLAVALDEIAASRGVGFSTVVRMILSANVERKPAPVDTVPRNEIRPQ